MTTTREPRIPPARAVSAPGKLVVAGEYAVLSGHEALVTGVSKRARAVVVGGDMPFSIGGMGLGPFVVERVRDDGVVFRGDAKDTLALLRSVVEAALARGVALPSTGSITVGSRAFLSRARGVKLGLGSSAAAAVALAGALVPDVTDRARVFDIALAGHLAFSGGRGSGIDVAASTMGGLARFRRDASGPHIAAGPRVPRALSVVVAFAGHAQNTRTFVDAVRAFSERDPTGHAGCIEAIAGATGDVLSSCERREDVAFLRAIDACRHAMQALGERAGIDIVSAPHAEIARVASSCGGAAKPSGAGGGDVALAFVPHATRALLEARLAEAGFVVVDVRLFSPGVRVDRPRAERF